MRRSTTLRPGIVTFWGDERPQVRFEEGGILVINAKACKGLEFDTVVLADIDEYITSDESIPTLRGACST